MRNHPLYKKIKNYALAKLSYDDFDGMSPAQILVAADVQDRVSGTFAINMKKAVLAALQNRDDENRVNVLKTNIKNFLDTNFPGWEAETGRENGKPFVKIWLRGKSNVTDNNL